MKKNTYMHFEEESIIYKFQLDTCMFDTNILLTKFGPGFWSRLRALVLGFIPSLFTPMKKWRESHIPWKYRSLFVKNTLL